MSGDASQLRQHPTGLPNLLLIGGINRHIEAKAGNRVHQPMRKDFIYCKTALDVRRIGLAVRAFWICICNSDYSGVEGWKDINFSQSKRWNAGAKHEEPQGKTEMR